MMPPRLSVASLFSVLFEILAVLMCALRETYKIKKDWVSIDMRIASERARDLTRFLLLGWGAQRR